MTVVLIQALEGCHVLTFTWVNCELMDS